MFRLTRKPSSGSHNQYLAKITHLVQSGYVEVVQDVSFMVAYCDLWGVCTVHCVRVYSIKLNTVYPHTVHSTHASQVTICSHNTDVSYELCVSTLNQVCNYLLITY